MLGSAWDAITRWATAIFGSWPNATQGSVGALASVGAALLVVGLTRRHERRLALEGDARRAVAGLTSTLRRALSESFTADHAQLAAAANDIALAMIETLALVTPADPASAERLERVSHSLDLFTPTNDFDAADFRAVVGDIADACLAWLAGRSL